MGRSNVRLVAVLVVLSVVLLAHSALTLSGTGRRGGVTLGSGLPFALGGLLVQPADARDVVAIAGGCPAGRPLLVPHGTACRYDLRSGFLARRLTLTLSGRAVVEAKLTQPDPATTDIQTLNAAHPTARLIYRESGSRLSLTCRSGPEAGCTMAQG